MWCVNCHDDDVWLGASCSVLSMQEKAVLLACYYYYCAKSHKSDQSSVDAGIVEPVTKEKCG